jgi:toxin ParE1/3/4
LTVRWSHSAQDDLDRIYGFIAEDNPDAAARIQDKVLAAGESLVRFADRGRLGRIPDTRELVVAQTPYFLVYTKDGGATVILRVMHGARLWPPVGEG